MPFGRAASPAEVLAIRRESERGLLDTRAWADKLGCSLETVRRIARRETYRGMHLEVDKEPTEADVAQSLEKLQQSIPTVPQTAQGVDALLDQITERGKK